MFYLYENGRVEHTTNLNLELNVYQNDVFQFAERMRNHLNFKNNNDIRHVVQQLGGNLEIGNLHLDNQDGSILVNGEGHFTIYLPEHTGDLRDNFTIAHELGHYILHTNYGAKVTNLKQEIQDLQAVGFYRHESNRLEWEANWFGSSFLMPESDFKNLVSQGLDNYTISAIFNVSVNAVIVRKKVLGI
jgi:Zn-dependent peptidase ImmA (M78 family)